MTFKMTARCKEPYSQTGILKGEKVLVLTHDNFATFSIDDGKSKTTIEKEEFEKYFELETMAVSNRMVFEDELEEICKIRDIWNVKQDITAHQENVNMYLRENDIEKVAVWYVVQKRYDCNSSYWDNLAMLMKEAYDDIPEEERKQLHLENGSLSGEMSRELKKELEKRIKEDLFKSMADKGLKCEAVDEAALEKAISVTAYLTDEEEVKLYKKYCMPHDNK